MRDKVDLSNAPPTNTNGTVFVVLTPPSALAAAVLHAVHELARRSLGSVDMLKLSTIEALRSEMQARTNRHLLLYSDCPAPAAVDLITQASPPVLVFADDPVRVAQSLQSRLGSDPIASIRTTALSFATLHDLVLRSTRTRVLAPHDWPSLADFLAQAAKFLALPTNAEDIAKVVSQFGALEEWQIAIADPQLKILPGGGIVSPFRSIFDMQEADNFFWPAALFFGTDPLGSPLQKQIDLTGPARPLLYGPYMHLPPGPWEMRIRFTVAENKSGNALLFEWLEGGDIKQSARVSALPESGQFQFSLQIRVVDPREPLQLRMSILEGAIEGIFEFEGAELWRRASTTS